MPVQDHETATKLLRSAIGTLELTVSRSDAFVGGQPAPAQVSESSAKGNASSRRAKSNDPTAEAHTGHVHWTRHDSTRLDST